MLSRRLSCWIPMGSVMTRVRILYDRIRVGRSVKGIDRIDRSAFLDPAGIDPAKGTPDELQIQSASESRLTGMDCKGSDWDRSRRGILTRISGKFPDNFREKFSEKFWGKSLTRIGILLIFASSKRYENENNCKLHSKIR